MKRLAAFVGATIGGAVGWWAGDSIGTMTAFFLSVIGTAIGMYFAVRLARSYTP